MNLRNCLVKLLFARSCILARTVVLMWSFVKRALRILKRQDKTTIHKKNRQVGEEKQKKIVKLLIIKCTY